LVEFEEVAWRCVDKIGLRKPHDLVVYVPIDSVVPTARPEFAFLAPQAKADGSFRIRTIRLRKEVSQGLIIDKPPDMDIIKWYLAKLGGLPEHIDIVGIDMSEYLGIKKYEPTETQPPRVAGTYPGWCEKSDAERYQNYNRNIEPHSEDQWCISLKLDGMSCTVFYDKERENPIGVCSRNWEVNVDDTGANKWIETEARPENTNNYWKAAFDFDLIIKVQGIATHLNASKVALQGEICGPGIQKNKMGLDKIQFYAFDIYNGQTNEFLDYPEFLKICKMFDIQTVPILQTGRTITNDIQTKFDWVKDLKYSNSTPAEGAVFVAVPLQRIGTLGRLKFKFISPTFLLKYED